MFYLRRDLFLYCFSYRYTSLILLGVCLGASVWAGNLDGVYGTDPPSIGSAKTSGSATWSRDASGTVLVTFSGAKSYRESFGAWDNNGAAIVGIDGYNINAEGGSHSWSTDPLLPVSFTITAAAYSGSWKVCVSLLVELPPGESQGGEIPDAIKVTINNHDDRSWLMNWATDGQGSAIESVGAGSTVSRTLLETQLGEGDTFIHLAAAQTAVEKYGPNDFVEIDGEWVRTTSPEAAAGDYSYGFTLGPLKASFASSPPREFVIDIPAGTAAAGAVLTADDMAWVGPEVPDEELNVAIEAPDTDTQLKDRSNTLAKDKVMVEDPVTGSFAPAVPVTPKFTYSPGDYPNITDDGKAVVDAVAEVAHVEAGLHEEARLQIERLHKEQLEALKELREAFEKGGTGEGEPDEDTDGDGVSDMRELVEEIAEDINVIRESEDARNQAADDMGQIWSDGQGAVLDAQNDMTTAFDARWASVVPDLPDDVSSQSMPSGSGAWPTATIPGLGTIDFSPYEYPWIITGLNVVRELVLWLLVYGFVHFALAKITDYSMQVATVPQVGTTIGAEDAVPVLGKLASWAKGSITATAVMVTVVGVYAAGIGLLNSRLVELGTGWSLVGYLGSGGPFAGVSAGSSPFWGLCFEFFPLSAFLSLMIAELILYVGIAPLFLAASSLVRVIRA